MKFRIVGLIAACALFAGSAAAQKKTAKKPAPKKTTISVAKTIPPLDVRTAREKVDIQLSNVNDYLAKLAPLAANLETAIADQKAGKLRAETSAGVDRARRNLVQSVHDIGLALNTLESEFRTRPQLGKYLQMIQGITDLSAQSEDAASQGRFVASKDPLRRVVQKLTDTLAVMPR